MNTSTLMRSLPASAVGRWRSLRLRTRVALALAALAIASGAWFGLASLFDPWPARAVLTTPGDTWPLAFSPDGRTFLTSGEGGITSWDVSTGRKGDFWAVADGGSALFGEFSPDGRTFASAVFSGTKTLSIVLIDAASGRTRADFPTPFHSVFGLTFADDGRTLRALLGDVPDLKEMRSWDLETGLEQPRRSLAASTKSAVATISADGTTLALGSWRRSVVELWDLDADRSLGSVMDPNSVNAVSWWSMGLSHDGRTLAFGREDGAIEVWDVFARKTLATLKGHSPGFASSWLRFSSDGRTFASEAVLIRPSPLGQIAGEIQRRLGLRSPGEMRDTEVIVLEIATGRQLARCANSIHPFFSPDGRTIATRERDLSVKLRDLPGSPK